jgi:hypothetical protein
VSTLEEEFDELRRSLTDLWALMLRDFGYFLHNVIAHPLLVIWPKAGGWLHDLTIPTPLVRTCRECGCTDDRACVGGCSWIEADLCSACDPF